MRKKIKNLGPSNGEYYYTILKSNVVKPYTNSFYEDYWIGLYILFIILSFAAGVAVMILVEGDELLETFSGILQIAMMGVFLGTIAYFLGLFIFPKCPDFTDTRYRRAMKKLFPTTAPYQSACYQTDLYVANLYFLKLLDKDDRKTLKKARSVIFAEGYYQPETAEYYMQEMNRIRKKHKTPQIPINSLDRGRAKREQKKREEDFNFVMVCIKKSLKPGQKLKNVTCEEFYKTLKEYKDASESREEKLLYDAGIAYIDSAFLTYLLSQYILSEKKPPANLSAAEKAQTEVMFDSSCDFEEVVFEEQQELGTEESFIDDYLAVMEEGGDVPEPPAENRQMWIEQGEWIQKKFASLPEAYQEDFRASYEHRFVKLCISVYREEKLTLFPERGEFREYEEQFRKEHEIDDRKRLYSFEGKWIDREFQEGLDAYCTETMQYWMGFESRDEARRRYDFLMDYMHRHRLDDPEVYLEIEWCFAVELAYRRNEDLNGEVLLYLEEEDWIFDEYLEELDFWFDEEVKDQLELQREEEEDLRRENDWRYYNYDDNDDDDDDDDDDYEPTSPPYRSSWTDEDEEEDILDINANGIDDFVERLWNL